MPHQTVVTGFAVLACGLGLFRLISSQIIVTESSYLVLPMFVAAVCVRAVTSPFLHNKSSASRSTFAQLETPLMVGGAECPPYLLPLQQRSCLCSGVSIDSCTFGLTLMSPQCQGLWSGNHQEGLIKRKLFPRAGRNAISWLEN